MGTRSAWQWRGEELATRQQLLARQEAATRGGKSEQQQTQAEHERRELEL